MSAGSIVVSLLLSTGSFSTDVARSAKDLEKLKKEALSTGRALGDSLKSIAAAAGLTLSIAGLSSLVKGAIDANDHLNDLSKTTGIAVDTLGGIGFAAKQAGGDLDSAAAAVGKLNKSIAAARAGDKQARQAFDVLGLQGLVESGATAEQVLEALADKFAQFEDGPEKAALAVRIFGKAGADMIPLLDEGGQALRDNIEYFKRYSGVTEEAAKASDQFNDTLEKVGLLSQSFGTTLAAELLPTLQAIADEILDAKEKSDLFTTAASAISETLKPLVVVGANVAFVFKGIGREIGAIAAQLAALARGDFDGFTAISDAVREDAKRAREELDAFERRVLSGQQASTGQQPFSDARLAAQSRPKARAPGLPSSTADAELKKTLDGQVKLIQEFAKQQQEAYQFAQRFVDGVFEDGRVSLQEKFATEKRLRDAGLAAQVKALDDEIALEQKAAKKVTGADRIDIENKIKEAAAKRAEAIQKASQADILAAAEEVRQVKALRDSYDDLRATVADLKGDTAGAASIRNDKAVESARQLITRTGGDPAIADEYGELLGKTTQLSQAQRDYNALLGEARDREEAVMLAAQESGASELDTLRAVGAERQKSLEQLGALALRAQDLAEALNTPEAVAFAEQLALAFKRAAAEVDPLLLKIRDISQEAGNSLGDIFGRAAQEGRGLKSILADIGNLVSDIATKELISKPLGKMFGDMLGGTGKDGGILGSFFGAGGGGGADALSASAGTAATSLAALQAVGIEPSTSALLRFQAALDSMSFGSASGGEGGDFWGGLFDSIVGGFTGGDTGGSSNSTGGSFHDPVYDGGYASGGYTGSGQKNEAAGIVHKGEFVNRQEVVRQPGARDFLERFNRVGMKALEGYADGGLVAGAVGRVYSRSPALSAASVGGARQANERPIQISQTFPPGTTRETTNQAAAAAGMAVRRALKRNG
jgi:hypothetical protein